MRLQQNQGQFVQQHQQMPGNLNMLKRLQKDDLNNTWAHRDRYNFSQENELHKKSNVKANHSVEHQFKKSISRHHSSSVELSAKFSKARPQMHPIQNDQKRASTLEASYRNQHTKATSFYTSHDEEELSEVQRNSQSQSKRANERRQKREKPINSYQNIKQSIQEEPAEHSSSLPSQQYTVRGPSQELLNALDFSFFRKVYNSYNTIWQQVLKLPIYGDNYVQRHEFVRVLKNCKVIESESSNLFCNFLLFSCANHLKSADPRREDKVLLDFRLFLKSVFMTLKRQFNEASTEQQEKVFHADMFLVDHFWQFVCSSELIRQASDRGVKTKTSFAQLPESADRNIDSLHIELLQQKLFEFFDRKQAPYLLQINEIERIVTECFKNLIERKKRKDVISIRSFKNVISRQCHGIFCKALTSFCATQLVEIRSSLVPVSNPTDSERFNNTAALSQKLSVSGKETFKNKDAIRHELHPRSLPRTVTPSVQPHSAVLSCDTSILLSGNRDQKSISENKKTQDELKMPPQNAPKATQKKLRSSQSQPPINQKRGGLCQQLETKIFTRKLQSVFESFKKRLVFAAINNAAFEPPYQRSPSEDSLNTESLPSGTKSSEGLEMPVETSPISSNQRQTHIVQVQKVSQNRLHSKTVSQTQPIERKHNEKQRIPIGIRRHLSNVEQPKKQDHKTGQTQQDFRDSQNKRSHQRESAFSNANSVGYSHGHQATTASQKNSQKEVTYGFKINGSRQPGSNHLFSYQDQQADQTKYVQEDLVNISNFSQQNMHSSNDQKGRSKYNDSKQRRGSSQEISDQKVPAENANSSRSGETTDFSGRINGTTEILTKILKKETMNHEYLKELVQRVSSLEESNKLVARRQDLEQVQLLHDFMHSSPPHLVSPTASLQAAMTFQPESSERESSKNYQNCYDQKLDYPNITEDYSNERSETPKEPSELEFTRNHSKEQQLYLITAQQRIQVNKYQKRGGENAQFLHQQNRLQSHSYSQSQPSLSQTQSVELCPQEQLIQQHFYEVSKEEDRYCLQEEFHEQEYDEDEMDFEANKEQRPLQIREHLSPNQNFSISSTSYQSSQRLIEQPNTYSDPYVNTTDHQQVQSLGSSSNNPYDLPYAVTTSSKSRSHQTNGHQIPSYKGRFQSNGHTVAQDFVSSHQPSLCYTVSETEKNPKQTETVLWTTSAPNLMKINSGIIDEQIKAQMNEVPYSNRLEGMIQFDPLSYLSQAELQLAQSQSKSSVPTEDLHNQANAAGRDQAYLKKYKKAKKQLRLLLREKRDSEQRATEILNENSLLQDHIQKTAISAQEVQNQNSIMQNELHFQKVYYAIRNLSRILASKHMKKEWTSIRKFFTQWQAKSQMMKFLQEQNTHQERILDQLKLHESSFKRQIHQMEMELNKIRADQRVKAIKSIFSDRIKKKEMKTFQKWRSLAQIDSARALSSNMQENLHNVITQLNYFRLQLVLTKFNAALKRGVIRTLDSAFESFKETKVHRKDSTPKPVSKPPQYKSPFMMHLTRNPAQSLAAFAPPQIVGSETYKQPIISSRARNDQEILNTYGDFRSSHSISTIVRRTQSTSQTASTNGRIGLILQKDCNNGQQADSGQRHHPIPEREGSDDSPLAPRQKHQAKGRSQSYSRHSKKQEFQIKMDDRMQKMRSQGKQVIGLAKLHSLYTRMIEKRKKESSKLVFTVLLNYCIGQRRQEKMAGDIRRRASQERQIFPSTTQKFRSASHNLIPPGQISAAAISFTSSGGSPSPNIGSFKVSSGSLNFGSSHNYREALQEFPRERAPAMHRDLNKEGVNQTSLRHHMRTSSENHLEPPRIMMGISPSMNNISGPVLPRSATTVQFKQATAAINLQNRRIPPKPQKWLP